MSKESCSLCPLDERCRIPYEAKIGNVEKFIQYILEKYPKRVEFLNLLNGKVDSYITYESDLYSRVNKIKNWLINGNHNNNGFPYFLEYFLCEIIKQLIRDRKIQDIQIYPTPTNLDFVHGKDGQGGDIIVLKGQRPLCLVDITISNKKRSRGLIHKPTGIPVCQVSIRKDRINQSVCNTELAELIKALSRRSINEGIYLNGEDFLIPQDHINLLRSLLGRSIILSAQETINIIKRNLKSKETEKSAILFLELILSIF